MMGGYENGLKRRFVAATLALCFTITQSWTESLEMEGSALPGGPGSVYTRAEVEAIVANLLEDAAAEIERTALEAAQEVAAKDAGEIAFQKNLAESLAREKVKAEQGRAWWRNAALVEIAVIAGGALVLALSR